MGFVAILNTCVVFAVIWMFHSFASLFNSVVNFAAHKLAVHTSWLDLKNSAVNKSCVFMHMEGTGDLLLPNTMFPSPAKLVHFLGSAYTWHECNASTVHMFARTPYVHPEENKWHSLAGTETKHLSGIFPCPTFKCLEISCQNIPGHICLCARAWRC